MDKLGKLDLGGFTSLGVVAAALLAGWIATSQQIAARHEARLARDAVTLSEDGRMKVTVTAKSDVTVPRRQLNVIATRAPSPPTVSTLAPVSPCS
jgi:hypothetical protein